MLRFLTLSAVLGFAAASGYGGGYGGGGGGGGGYGSFYGHGGGGYGHSVHAAVISHHNVKHYDVPSSGYTHPVSIDVPANVLPVNFIFRSSSSHINVASKHEGAAGSFKETHSQDEPHVLRHTVTKPIIQEVREIITPSRSIVQTIQPVREQISTVVARNAGGGGFGGGAGGGAGGGFGGGFGGGAGGGGGFGGGFGGGYGGGSGGGSSYGGYGKGGY